MACYEDFRPPSYTEDDTGGYLSQTITRETFTLLPRIAGSALYDDKGAGHFGDYEHLIDVCLTGGNGTSIYAWVWAVSNEIGNDYYDFTAFQGVSLRIASGAPNYQIQLWDKGGAGVSAVYGIALNTTYYLTIKRAGNTLTCKIYSDSARTALLATLTIAGCAVTTWRYIYATFGHGYAGPEFISGYCEFLDLQEIVLPTVVTNAATRCPAMDQATLNGNVTATGGENVTRGFRWGTNLGGPYPNSWSDAGTHGAGVYSHTIVGLAKDITFYYTAVATNCRGTSYGAEQAFNSNPATPTNLAGVCVGFIVPNIIPIMLTWTDNSSIETAYYVERDDGGWHVISGALPPNTQTYTDNTAICGTAYSYRVRAYDGTCYSAYNTLGVPISCTCPPTPEEEIPVPEKQHITDAIKEWMFQYPFQSPTVEGIYCIVIAPFRETKPIKASLSELFEETRKVKGKTGELFEETTPPMIKSDIKKEFDETSINIVGPIVKRFEEAKLIDVEWTFTLAVSTKIKGRTISKEEMFIDELDWL